MASEHSATAAKDGTAYSNSTISRMHYFFGVPSMSRRAKTVARERYHQRHETPDQRAVLELQLAGLTTPEIAAALGRSQGAIRILRFRAQTRLRDLLTVTDTHQRREEGRPC